MPVYDYECDVCGIRFSYRRSFGGPEPESCPQGHTAFHRVFAAPAIIFKGSGFYVTDHARNGRMQSAAGKTAESEPGKAQASSDGGSKDGGKESSKDSGKEGGKE